MPCYSYSYRYASIISHWANKVKFTPKYMYILALDRMSLNCIILSILRIVNIYMLICDAQIIRIICISNEILI